MNKREVAEAIQALGKTSGGTAYLCGRYTLPELLTLLEACSYEDGYTARAQWLFGKVHSSQWARKHRGSDHENVLKAPMTRADADAWGDAHDKAVADAKAALAAANDGKRECVYGDGLNDHGHAADGAQTPLKIYTVTLITATTPAAPEGIAECTLIASSGELAAKRAKYTLVHARVYGDIDQIEWLSVEDTVCGWFARCENDATRFQTHPILGEVPICDRCKALADKHR